MIRFKTLVLYGCSLAFCASFSGCAEDVSSPETAPPETAAPAGEEEGSGSKPAPSGGSGSK